MAKPSEAPEPGWMSTDTSDVGMSAKSRAAGASSLPAAAVRARDDGVHTRGAAAIALYGFLYTLKKPGEQPNTAANAPMYFRAGTGHRMQGDHMVPLATMITLSCVRCSDCGVEVLLLP